MDYKESVRAGPEEKNLMLTVHYSNQCGNAKNCLYPYSGTSDNPEDLRVLFSHDHTFIDFKDNYRCIDNWPTGTGLRTFKHITHLQDKPLVTYCGDEGLNLSWLQSHCYFRDSVGIADVVG